MFKFDLVYRCSSRGVAVRSVPVCTAWYGVSVYIYCVRSSGMSWGIVPLVVGRGGFVICVCVYY
jgi:hypothetical protein